MNQEFVNVLGQQPDHLEDRSNELSLRIVSPGQSHTGASQYEKRQSERESNLGPPH